MTTPDQPTSPRPRLLIEEWLPIAEIGIESVRERTPMTPFPAPNRLHVWWARRPLVASRAAILASLLPADADHEKFLHVLGIHGDPVASKERIAEARRTGQRFEGDAYSYKRAFAYTPSAEECRWLTEEHSKLGYTDVPTVLDPTAGGGSIPFEASRAGLHSIGNDLNSVAWLILKATIEFPAKFGRPLLKRYQTLAADFIKRRDAKLEQFFPAEPLPNSVATNWIWARTVHCPYCGGLVPLSPNWRLDSSGTGVKLIPHTGDPDHRHCTFEIVTTAKEQSAGTVKGGQGLCPYPGCGRVIDGDDIKSQAQAGRMGDQLYAVVYKQTVKTGTTKTGKDKVKFVRGFRAPRPEDDVSDQVDAAVAAKMPEWEARNIAPTEDILPGYETAVRWPLNRYGLNTWQDMFNRRQLLGHCVGVETFHELLENLRNQGAKELLDVDKIALCYIAIAMDKLLNYNARMTRWIPNRMVLAGVFDRHDFSFKWSYGEMAPTITGLGYDWTIEQTGKALEELIELSTGGDDKASLFQERRQSNRITITHGTGDSLALDEASVDCIVMDPPYYNNVTYSELSDFFYVWLKRTVGTFFPESFSTYLTEKDQEAIANPFRFRNEGGAMAKAKRDYQERMAAIFMECHRVLKPDGVMTVMFTHKASGAWDALANGLVQAGFVITASWPINTEAEGSLHIKEKSAAKSTIFLVCRPREERTTDDVVYWEEVEPQVMAKVRERVQEFQNAGIGGVDLYLACFGPALQVFSENWPLKRGRPIQMPKKTKLAEGQEWDPYAVNPEDALDAARREVKRWRMEQLATVKRQHHLDPLTEWYVLAWDAFRAPRFPSDEALKLARVVGLDFDRDVKNVVCEVKSSDVVLWDSKTRQAKSKLGPVGEEVMLDTLHHAALIGREQNNTGAAQAVLEKAGLLKDSTLLTALEALLNVLPAPGATAGKKKDDTLGGASSDCEALEKLRRLALSDEVPEPMFSQRVLFTTDAADEEDDED